MKLHPDAVPKREPDAPEVYSSLHELCVDVIRREGWALYFEVRTIPGTRLVQVLLSEHYSRETDRPIIFTESEDRFQNGMVTQQGIRAECSQFLRKHLPRK